jgi:DNA-binding transcriptional MocR family regulator
MASALDALAYALEHQNIKACLFVLNFANPLGSCMPDEKRRGWFRCWPSGDIPLIENDIYGSLYFGKARPRTAKSFDRHGRVLLCDSFNKILAPGYRVGWVAPGRYQSRIEYLKFITTDASASLSQMAIAEFLANGSYEHHLRKLRRIFAAGIASMSEAIAQHFPAGTRLTRPAGGQLLWVELPAGVDSLELYRRALQQHISIAPGPIFPPNRSAGISFASIAAIRGRM